MTNTPSTELVKNPRAARATARGALILQSAGHEGEDLKNQDRLNVTASRGDDGMEYQFAIVCDGTSSSPFADEAAAYVAARVGVVFEEGGIGRVTASLKELRTELLGRPLQLEEGQSEPLRSMFEEIVRQKYQSAYQTTFVAVRLKQDEDSLEGAATVTAVGCGDSALFIFREDGELLYNNMNLADASDPFRHASPFTAVLPDSYDDARGNVLVEELEVAADVHLLLCSDGFYDGFTNFGEALDWLRTHRDELRDPAACAIRARSLHEHLEQKKGDDDISFIWLHPAAPPPEVPEKPTEEDEATEQVEAVNEDNGSRRARLLDRLLAFLLRLLKRTPRDSAGAARR